jgi:hypothetical protein
LFWEFYSIQIKPVSIAHLEKEKEKEIGIIVCIFCDDRITGIFLYYARFVVAIIKEECSWLAILLGCLYTLITIIEFGQHSIFD